MSLQSIIFVNKILKTFVRAKARSYFLVGADREDIIQEGDDWSFIRLRGILNMINWRPLELLRSFV